MSAPANSSLLRVLLVSQLAVASVLAAQPTGAHPGAAEITQNYGKLPLSFEANQGQAGASVHFLSRGKGYTLFLTGTAAILALTPDTHPSATGRFVTGHDFSRAGQTHGLKGVSAPATAGVIQMQLLHANPSAPVTGADPLPGIANYFLGNDPAQWHTNIPTYAKVRCSRVYDGIDLVYYGNQGQLEYDFVVAPHADPGQIRLHFAGASPLALNPAGDLIVSARSARSPAIAFRRPEVYQQSGARRIPVRGAFQLASSDTAVFRLGSYDRSRPLVIDPTLDYATSFGGKSGASIHAVAFDADGNVYLAGSAGAGLAVVDPLQPAALSSPTGFISEINQAGTALIYSTYFGGSGGDQINGITLDKSGNLYIAGTTSSRDFPTLHPLQAAPKSLPTGFVSEIAAGGASLLYSTYLGGSGGDFPGGIALDGAGNAYVAGNTSSSDFPLKNPIQATNNDQYGTGFVSEIAAGGGSLVYSTYLGGSGGCDSTDICDGDQILGLAADEAGNAYISGATGSYDFPVANALQTENLNRTSGYTDPPYTGPNIGYETPTGFVSKIQPGGGAFVYSTYLGGSGQCDAELNYLGYDWLIACTGDSAASIVADASGNAYVAGTASSPDFPLMRPFQSSVGPVSTGFVSVINPTGSAFLYSTYLGGSGYCDFPQYYYQGTTELCFGDGLAAIAIDARDNIYVAGNASSNNVPLQYPLPELSSFGPSGTSPYISALRSGGQSLLYSTYFGGSLDCNSLGYCVGDQVNVLAADAKGDIVIAGTIASANFPFTNPLPGMTGSSTFLAEISPAPGPAATPVFSLASGTYNSVQQVTISSPMPEDIHYTTDGSTPTTLSPLYRWPFTVAANETIKALGSAGGYIPSPVASASYVVHLPLKVPVISLASGTYSTVQTVTVRNQSSGAILHYTLDGTTPTASSAIYGGPITVYKSETLRVIALAPVDPPSPVASATYTIHLSLDTPVLSLASGTYTGAQTVTATDATSIALLFYTTNGTTPTASSPRYTGPITIGKSETLKVIALATGYPPSIVATATYTIH